MPQVTIYTLAQNPFQMGGLVSLPVKTTVEAEGPFDAGRGISVYVATAPNGHTFVAEAETGAIVGSSLEEVRQDVADADQAVLDEQMDQAREAITRAGEWEAERFWRALGCLPADRRAS